MKIPTKEVNELHSKAVRTMDEAGMDRLVIVVSRDIHKMAGVRVVKESGILDKVKIFDNIDEAEDWLDG